MSFRESWGAQEGRGPQSGSGEKHYLGLGLRASSRPDGSGGGWKIRAPREAPWVSGGWRHCGEPWSLGSEGGLFRGPVRAVLCFGEEDPWVPWFSPQSPLALLLPRKEQCSPRGPSGVLRGSSQPSSARWASRCCSLKGLAEHFYWAPGCSHTPHSQANCPGSLREQDEASGRSLRQHWPQASSREKGGVPHPPLGFKAQVGEAGWGGSESRLWALRPGRLGARSSTPVPQFPAQEASKVCFIVRL